MLLRVPSLIEFGSHCLQTSGCTGGFIEFSMKCCSPNAVKGKQPTSEEPCATDHVTPRWSACCRIANAPSSGCEQAREALGLAPDPTALAPQSCDF